MLRTPTARWAAPCALLAGFACANVQADEIDIPSFNAQSIGAWDLSVRENSYSPAPDRTRFPLHGPAVVGDWLRLNTPDARNQHSYATALGSLDPNLPTHISYEFMSWTDQGAEPRVLGFQLFDADLANSLDHLDYCGSKAAVVRVLHGHHNDWGALCGATSPDDIKQRTQAWGPGDLLLANVTRPLKLACGEAFTALDASWHCATREEAIQKGYVRTVRAWLWPKGEGAGYRLDLMIDNWIVFDGVQVPATRAHRLRFGFLSKAEIGASYAEIRNVRVSQTVRMVSIDSLNDESNGRCINVWGNGVASHRQLQAYECNGSENERITPSGQELRIGGYCLEVEGGANVFNARIVTRACNGAAGQSWKVTSEGSIRSLLGGVPRCITSFGSGYAMRMHDCENTTQQRFFPMSIY